MSTDIRVLIWSSRRDLPFEGDSTYTSSKSQDQRVRPPFLDPRLTIEMSESWWTKGWGDVASEVAIDHGGYDFVKVPRNWT